MARIARAGILLIDRILNRYYGVFEFSSDRRGILRLSRSRSPRDILLSDGAQIRKGAALLVLHFRNEQLAAVLRHDATLESGLVFVRGARRSLLLLAGVTEEQREFDNVRALYAEFGFIQDERGEQLNRMAVRLGFDLMRGERAGWNLLRRAFWDDLFSWWLMWGFNPESLRGKSFTHIRRNELWMSRSRLLEGYGEHTEQLERSHRN